MDGGLEVVVATNAFGMGIDKPDVRFVFHAEVAAAVVAAGPGAGRKELRERTGLSPRRLTGLLDLLERVGAVRLGTRRADPVPGGPEPEEAAALARALAERRREVERTRLEMMRRYTETEDCRRRFLLGYFGEHLPEPCGNCDTCRAGTAARPAGPGGGPFPLHARVQHRTWGPGQVIQRGEDRLTVLFEEAGYRELQLDAVLEQDLLTRADGDAS